ncbi:MAG TPA: phosphodiesterase [Intrasporangium sp.]|uniref:phosphodiesterase n=1 Tax=Intrasporangium sp. TaxID=1925024 RepID=UPI002D77414F|nr:phosphodiesterase [Intrasporangium sp.]HET7398172.1 phosphodiesterase [Intrasporangium sp.]
MSGSSRQPGAGALAQRLAGGVFGAALGAAFATTALLRRTKPLHPEGVVSSATLRVTPADARSGVPLLDTGGEHACTVRASYAVGTGPEAPDIEGFALRLPAGGAGRSAADVLFASTGTGRLSRFVLAVRRPGVHASLTTLLPVRAADGSPLLLRLDPRPTRGAGVAGAAGAGPLPAAYALSWAHGRGQWHECGELAVPWDSGGADAPRRFDPVANPLPGTGQYPLVEWLREPAYALSRLAWPRAGRLG